VATSTLVRRRYRALSGCGRPAVCSLRGDAPPASGQCPGDLPATSGRQRLDVGRRSYPVARARVCDDGESLGEHGTARRRTAGRRRSSRSHEERSHRVGLPGRPPRHLDYDCLTPPVLFSRRLQRPGQMASSTRARATTTRTRPSDTENRCCRERGARPDGRNGEDT